MTAESNTQHEAHTGLGDYIDGAWVPVSGGTVITSHNPAMDGRVVARVHTDAAHVDQAVAAARKALGPWRALSQDERNKALRKLADAFLAHKFDIAAAITSEMGKPLRESLTEAKALAARVELMIKHGLRRVSTEYPEGVPGETRYHSQGVMAVLGPYNFPCHLMNAHVIPALLTGNTVIIKPSEVTPLSGEWYARCVEEAGLPPGVFNLVQGARDVGAGLTTHPGVDGVLFTGSWGTGRAISEQLLDHPGKMLALEMGGKNIAVVLEDADPHQALVEIVQGAFLTTGQRCTATSRVMVHEAIADRFIEAMTRVIRDMEPGDPMKEDTAFGPLATMGALERFEALRDAAKASGVDVLVPGRRLPGGAYVTPSLHMLPAGRKDAPGYLDEELFGPDICIEVISDLDDAIERVNRSPYGLSNAVFTADKARFERFYQATRSGVLNWNRSTNGASGTMPFGGMGKSGNMRAAGIDAVRYTTYPVAVNIKPYGETTIEPSMKANIQAVEEGLEVGFDALVARHELEALLERYRIAFDDVFGASLRVPASSFAGLRLGGQSFGIAEVDARLGQAATVREHCVVLSVPAGRDGQSKFLADTEAMLEELVDENPHQFLALLEPRINQPAGGEMPRSAAMLRRLYRGDFFPQEKKTPVVDLYKSHGSYLVSIDEDPLVIVDAASQIASLGVGFGDGVFMKALDEGAFDDVLAANPDSTAPGVTVPAAEDYAKLLLSHTWDGLQHATFASGGAESNEKAFDLCRQNGSGGKRVVAFEGSFHGRTMISLFSTWNPVKRAPFQLPGFETAFVPFPDWKDPREEPAVTADWISAWTKGEAPAKDGDVLRDREIDSLLAVKAEIDKGDMCAVIVEPMQSEGGDNHGTARFFNGLRALTRGAGVALIFDEVQTGFRLGGPMFWHTRFDLKNAAGEADGPDVVTLAKKAQLGVVLSAWEDTRPSPVHAIQAARGALQAQVLLDTDVDALEARMRSRLWALAADYPALVQNPRSVGMCFAFDLPSKHVAMQIVAQRFYRGYMVYIAGERTVRFRLSVAMSDRELDQVITSVRAALDAIVLSAEAAQDEAATPVEAFESYTAPSWDDAPAPAKSRLTGGGRHFLKEVARLDSQPAALLEWLLALPRPPLERVCDRLLLEKGAIADDALETALGKLLGADADRGATAILSALRAGLAEAQGADDVNLAVTGWAAALGMSPVELLVQAIGARVKFITADDWDAVKDGVMAIETATYELGRQDTYESLFAMLSGEGGLGQLLVRRTDAAPQVLGYAFGGPVENFEADGPKQDPMRGRYNTFYSGNITLSREARGAGNGFRLKDAQVRAVRQAKSDAGVLRYVHMTGRNRVGLTTEMSRINRAFGAYPLAVYSNQYGDRSGQAMYYRIPLRRPGVEVEHKAPAETLEWASAVQAPLGPRPERVQKAVGRGLLTTSVGTKLTLSNWTTPDVVRYAELLRRVGPRGLSHTFFTSARDELVDKGLRALKVHRKAATTVIGLQKQFVGTNTAAARSLTDPAGHGERFGWFDWPLVPHPAEAGTDESLGAIRAAIDKVGKKDVLAVVVELVGEKSGLTLPADFVDGLGALRAETGVPVVAVETASALGRMGETLFASDSLPWRPNMVWWYTGGQLGQIFVDDTYYVAKPLTLISTWDGDEICARRTTQHLIAAKDALSDGAPARFAAAVADFGFAAAHNGAGLWHVFDLGDEAKAAKVIDVALERGLRLGRGLPGRVVVCPPLDVTAGDTERGLSILADVLEQLA